MQTRERLFRLLCVSCLALPLLMLGYLLARLVVDAWPRLTMDFLTGFPSRRAEDAGILPGIVGSLYLILLTIALALPVGVGAAIYLEEFGRQRRVAQLIEVNIANLAGVPSIIYGLLGLEVFVRFMGLGRSLIAGAATLALLVLPVIIMSTREALRTVPGSLREAAVGLGATRWQVVRRIVLPQAVPGIMTGSILAVSRAIGETAPLVVIGALTFITFLPDGPTAPFTALPIQIFNWVSRPQAAFAANAAAGILVLMVTLLALNAVAIYLRERMQRRQKGAH
jgi:phosphate transport system permease protein